MLTTVKKMSSLKTLCLSLCLTALLGGCSKHNSTPTNVPVDLSSARFYTPHIQVIDSFHVDFNKRIIQYTQYKDDTTGGFPATDSIVAIFVYSGGATTPTSFTLSRPSVGLSDLHQLTYDAQGRIIMDTSAGGFGAHFSYPGSNIATRLNYGSTPGTIKADTLFITNGNVSSLRIYISNSGGTGDSLYSAMTFARSTLPNPGYRQQAAENMGVLLFHLSILGFNGYADFVSPTIADNLIQIYPNSQSILLSFLTDSQGRVITAYIAGVPLSVYSYAFYYY